MIKRISFCLMFLLMLMSSVNAIEYINSCGKNSGWVNSETYIINFTEIPATYTNGYCLQVSDTITGVTIQGLNTTIENNNNYAGVNEFAFFEVITQGDVQTTTLKDLRFNYIERFIEVNETGTSSSAVFNFNTIENVHTNGTNQFIKLFANSEVSGNANFNFNQLDKVKAINIEDSFINGVSSSSVSTYRFNGVSNSVIIGDQNTQLYEEFGAVVDNDNDFNDSIIITGSVSFDGISYYDSLVRGYRQIDSDANGIGDTDPYPQITGGRTFLSKEGINAYQNYTFFFQFERNTAGADDKSLPAIIANNEVQGTQLADFSDSYPNGLIDFSAGSGIINKSLLQVKNSIVIDNTDLICGYATLSDCYFRTSAPSNVANLYDAYINAESSIIDNVNFEKNDNSEYQIINLGSQSVVIFGGEIKNSDFNASTTANTYGFLSINAQQTNVHNNNFKYDTVNSSASYYYIDSSSNNPETLNYYNNSFFESASTIDDQVFKDNCEGEFYNNYLDSNVVISNSCSDISATVEIGYLHSDGDIYFFEIGNYYEDNSACVDANGDAICDSSYVSGGVTDTKPLAVYPFPFSSQLGNALYIVTPDQFNVTATGVSEGENITINNASSIITLGFNHDSSFDNLTCIGYVDESPVYTSNINTANVTYTIDLTSWRQKAYTYRVACQNEFVNSDSGQVNFNVFIDSNFTDPEGDNGGQGDNNTNGIVVGSETGFNLFGDDIESSGDNLNSVFELAEEPLGWGIVLGFVFLAFSGISLVFAIGRMLL